MALQRFIESYSTLGTKVQSEVLTKSLQEKYQISADTVTRLRECAGNAAAPLRIYKFPISRFNHLNHNGRIYTGDLWDNVIQNQQAEWKGRTGLADHPITDDGEFKNSAIVWHDMEKDDVNNLIWGTGIFVGDYGRLAQEIVDSGGRIGFSSSGYGELMMDGKTVDPNTFQLERCADIVLTPSQDVFGDISNLSSSQTINYKSGATEIAEATSTNFKNTGTTPIQENTVAAEMTKPVISKMEEKKFRRDIQVFLEDASNLSSSEKLAQYEEMLTFFDQGIALDLKETIEQKIQEEKSALEEAANNGRKTLEAFGVNSAEELKIGVALLAEECNVAVSEAKDWEKIALVLREKNVEIKKALQEAEEKIEKLNKLTSIKERKFQRQVEQLDSSLSAKEASLKRVKSSIQEQVEETEEVKQEAEETVANLEEKIKDLKSQLRATREASVNIQKAASTRDRENKLLAEKVTKLESKLALQEKKAQRLESGKIADQDEKIAELQEALQKAKKQVVLAEKKATANTTSLREKVSGLTAQNNSLKNEIGKYKAERQTLLKSVKESKSQAVKAVAQLHAIQNPAPVNPLASIREGTGAHVEAYWADLVTRHGNDIIPYERQIRGCRTYKEAGNAYMKVLPLLNESGRQAQASYLPESSAIGKAERKQKLEEAGVTIGSTETAVDRLPTGWI